ELLLCLPHFLLSPSRHSSDLHSYPTRRSSDLIGPFKQILTLSNIPYKGAVKDEQLEILTDAALVVKDGKIEDVGEWSTIKEKYRSEETRLNSSHVKNSYAVFCLKKKKQESRGM